MSWSKAWGPAAAWAAVLFLLSEISAFPVRPNLLFADKVAHFVLYGVLGGALAWGRFRAGPSVPHWVPLSLGWFYGAMDEIHQGFVPGRSPELGDFVVDALGVLLGYGICLTVLRSGEDEDARMEDESVDGRTERTDGDGSR